MKYISILGLFVMMMIAWTISSDKKRMNFRLIFSGVSIQFIFALLILKTAPGETLFRGARVTVAKIIGFSDAGAQFVFGPAFKDHFFAFSVLPTIIFVSAVMAILFHIGIMQLIVKGIAKVMVWVMDTSGSESLAAAANIFIGQTEAPLVIKPYISTMTNSELMAMMTSGMATVAGGVMAAYAGLGADAGHLLAASIMSAPASLVIAKIIIPEKEISPTKGIVKLDIPKKDANMLDAACRGASEGMKLALNVAAMLIAFIAIIKLLNWGFELFPIVHGSHLSLQRILGWVFSPIAWLLGVEWKDALTVGSLLGQKTILNEFLAYTDLIKLKDTISPRSFTIATYALCGFANFSSIAIQIGGIGSLVPSRRKDFAKLGLKAMIGGTLAAFMTAAIAGMLI